MQPVHKHALTVLAWIALGVAGTTAIHAWQAKPAPGYIIAEVEVTDPGAMQKYAAKVPETLTPFGGKYLIRAGKTISLEGEPAKGIVVLQFDSVEKAQEWYNSPAYQAIRPIRQSAAKSRIFIAEGPPEQ